MAQESCQGGCFGDDVDVFGKKGLGKKKSSAVLPGGCMVLFGLPFLAGGLVASVFYFSGLIDWWSARTWVETPCRIVASELKVSTGDDSTSYEANGRYVYEWKGRKYESSRVSLVKGGDNIGDYQQRVHGEMNRALREREGAALCYVNPRDPTESVLMRELRIFQMAFFTIFCLLFPLVGAGVMVGGWWTSRSASAEKKLREEHPHEPWCWKPEWNVSPIPEGAWSAGRVLVFVALWWFLVTVPLLLAGVVDRVHERPDVWWMLIPGVFFLLAVWMVTHRLRERGRIGRVALELALPIRPGRDIAGNWITGKPLRPHDMPVLKIICRRSVTTHSGGESSTHTETVWEKEESLSVIDQTREISHFRMPFRFHLPVDVEETTFGEEETTKYSWKLEFRVPGTPVKSAFEVPVCRDPNEPVEDRMGEVGETKADEAGARLPELLEKAKLDATFDGGGQLTSLVCGPRRLFASILFLFLFNVVWTGFAVFLWFSDAPALFKVVWPGTSALIWVLVIYQILSRRELRLENGELHVATRFLLYRRDVAVSARDVAAVTHATNSSVNNTRYYWVGITTTSGVKVTVASGIAGEPAALGLAKHLERWRKAGRTG